MELHLFDFDGTLTRKDTLFEFAKFCAGPFRYYFGLFAMAPALAAVYFGLIGNDKGKKIFLKYFFGDRRRDDLEQCGREFLTKKLPSLLRPEGMEAIDKLKQKNHEVAIVSASLDIWLKPFCEHHGLKLICTRAKFNGEGKFTGAFEGANCNREEKRVRVTNEFKLHDYARIVAYGDSKDDQDLFNLSTQYYYRPFHLSIKS